MKKHCIYNYIRRTGLIFLISALFFQFLYGQSQSEDSTAHFITMSVRIHSGNLDFLNGQSKINIKFYTDSTIVGKLTEKEYTKKKQLELNEKEPGKGDTWLKEWNQKNANGKELFIESLNKQCAKRNLVFQTGIDDAMCSLLVNVKHIEEGWTIGLLEEFASATMMLSFYDHRNMSVENIKVALLTCVGTGAPGKLSDAYSVAGWQLGRAINKYFKKKE